MKSRTNSPGLLERILDELKSLENPEAVAGMARYGINPSHAYGVSIPNLRKIARKAGRELMSQKIKDRLMG